MNITQIEEKLKQAIDNATPQHFLSNFLFAYGSAKSEISRLQKGNLNVSKIPGETIIKKKLFFKEVETTELETILPIMANSKHIATHKLRFAIASDYKTICAIDTKTKESISLPITDLLQQVTFFLPLAGMEKYQTHEENEADVKVAVQMAKLFDEIKKINPTQTQEQVHHLNIFLSRLLFCYFAEDTGIFTNNLFTSSINNHTQADGTDLQDYLQKLFEVLNTEKRKPSTPAYLTIFPYVNGGLFKTVVPLPTFNTKIRQVIIDCGGQNWASINPDIFGSMIQAVVTPDQRGNLGMHYTSVPNIMKVIQPLFLDELYEEFEKAKNSPTALNKLLNRIANIRIFDPACGSGNFLIIAYKQLRLLEIKILTQLKNLHNNTDVRTGFEENQTALFSKPQLTLADNKRKTGYQAVLFSRIELNHFYGIELDDFAHEIAKLSLWLAQHQMNMEFNNLLGATNPSLPLSDAGQITQGNATRLHWETVCPKPKVGEVFILGNPPYLGARVQDEEQKKDMALVFEGINGFNNLDYIACWFKKGNNFISGNNNSKFAFVTTNSICQGEQVNILWKDLSELNTEIFFAYNSFKWSNNAKAQAAVIVSIIGLRNVANFNKFLYNKNLKRQVKNINAYLTNANNVFVEKRSKPLNTVFPEICFGSMPNDGGHLILSTEEKNELLQQYPDAKEFIKRFMGAQEFIRGEERFCLWITKDNYEVAIEIPLIKKRIEECRKYRLASKRKETKVLANIPYQFGEVRHQNINAIIIPSVSSENREYIPIGNLDRNTVISNAANSVYTNQYFMLSILTSNIHMCWLKSVGGRLKTDYRYSASLCYNTFPFPPITQAQKDELEQHTHNILKARANHTEKTLAEMYDPNKMPNDLRLAHQANDLAIEKCYRDKPFETDEERLAYLFNLYELMIAEEKTKGTLFEMEAKAKIKKEKRSK
jgi:type II restriction/modification system DNA methylase subunit YeeA